ncbi:MAG: MBL fold metallo-hydrolase [Desulfobacterales bacterium CG23_combo_of_CG06-09_8_20_14_all_51_8]|nr:MAG: MBL fold metallo-hydrolase [Desulfobacterales bacterium CG23_combo_of_CG06-09_8_20_14_all_51_8]
MLDLIDLDIDELGYQRFISAWVYSGDDGNFLVDPGPACTVDYLLAELEKRGVRQLDWIFLTHIHMDHSGGIGHVIERFPSAKIICHEKAVAHLVDPERLWEGSLKILGDVARVYGKIKPVPAENIRTAQDVPMVPIDGGFQVIATPGHAAHHQCFAGKDVVFCGELFGIFYQMENAVYLRPATPPVFVLEDFLSSMDAMAPFMDRRICFGHHGWSLGGERILKIARRQIVVWVDVIRRHLSDPDTGRIIGDLTENDPVFASRNRLPEALQDRENYFSGNSIRGILQYLKRTEA